MLGLSVQMFVSTRNGIFHCFLSNSLMCSRHSEIKYGWYSIEIRMWGISITFILNLLRVFGNITSSLLFHNRSLVCREIYLLLKIVEYWFEWEVASIEIMPLKREYSSEYTVGGTRVNLYENSQSMSRQRRFNPMIFLTICCGFFVLAIVGSLIVFTFLPIFSKVQGNQMKYQSIVSSPTPIDGLNDFSIHFSSKWGTHIGL